MRRSAIPTQPRNTPRRTRLVTASLPSVWPSFIAIALGVARNWEEAVRLYYRAGNAGIADAFAEGGMLFARENPPDYPEAKSWFEHAVQGGSADGYADLGWLYENGFGVNKDAAMALSLFNEAAKRGSAEGMYRVGVAYYDGLGVQKDLPTACQWFIRAGSYAHPYAEEETGLEIGGFEEKEDRLLIAAVGRAR